jgi:hypothetical protein
MDMRAGGKWSTFSRFEDEEGYQSKTLLTKQPYSEGCVQKVINTGAIWPLKCTHGAAVMAKETYGEHWQRNQWSGPVHSRYQSGHKESHAV